MIKIMKPLGKFWKFKTSLDSEENSWKSIDGVEIVKLLNKLSNLLEHYDKLQMEKQCK